MINNKKRTLGFDLMDELEPTEIKKASDIMSKSIKSMRKRIGPDLLLA